MRNLGAAVLGLVFFALSALIIAILFGWTGPIYVLNHITTNVVYSLLVAVGCLLLAVLAFSTIRGQESEQIAVQTSSKYGQIRISDRTIEEIVTRAGLSADGIKEIVPKVFPLTEGINISIQAVLKPEVVIPTVVEELQGLVKNDVENYTGLKVSEVKVMVRGIENSSAIRNR